MQNSRSLVLQLRPDAENKLNIYIHTHTHIYIYTHTHIYMSQILHEAIAFGSIHYMGHAYPINLLMVHLKFRFD